MTDNSQGADLAQIDVAGILEGLRAEVRARRLAQGQIEESPLERDLRRSLDEIELHRVVSAHWPLIGTTLPQRAIALINKLVRRYLRWYINPIVEQQNAYSDTVARALRLLAEAYADLGEQIAGTRRGIGDGRWETGDGRREMGDGRREMGDGRWETGDGSAEFVHAETAFNPQLPTPNSQLPGPDPQAWVHKRAQAEPPARFPDLELRALEPGLRLRQRVSAHWPLPATTPPQRAIALINKLVRRYLRWYINPIVEQQNAANAAIAAALLALIRLDAERRAQVAGLRAHRGQGTGNREQW
jgi:predicted nucleic acid-binding protein